MFISAPSAKEKRFSVISRNENPLGFATRPKKWRKQQNEIGKNIAVSPRNPRHRYFSLERSLQSSAQFLQPRPRFPPSSR